MIVKDHQGKCMLCGEGKVSGSWLLTNSPVFKGDLEICIDCATTTLPKLIADTVYSSTTFSYNHPFPQDTLSEQLSVIRANFFETLAKGATSSDAVSGMHLGAKMEHFERVYSYFD